MGATLAAVAAATMLVNLPFGYWREGTARFSLAWFLSVHAAVPVVVALRTWAGIAVRPATLPVLLVAYFAGQLLGSRARRWRRAARAGREGRAEGAVLGGRGGR